ncbi:MAG: polymer-forming cytoskeletal protein [Candidatus Neomarinimicrobiota bacterium]|nr:polymer-forming cytoskeletal protein [Candidatus Neomarinimicrobiota bacterium]|tara:strand:- start:58 stop:435 length:378 start_codon:yes stop_codon:yes gene_type:complete
MFQLDKSEKMINNKTSSILGPELEIHGDVKVSGSLLLYGKVFGNIHSNGSVRTADGSEVKGNISANEAIIGGKVDGDVDVNKKVTLGDSSKLTGNLKATTLTIEEGAKFEGVCNMMDKTQKKSNV